jgi:hypothetical protein
MNTMTAKECRRFVQARMEEFRIALCFFDKSGTYTLAEDEANKATIEEERQKTVDRYRKTKNDIETVLDHLGREDEMIIRNETLILAPRLWYLRYFSRSTYYRRRDIAYRRFVNFYQA